MQNITTNHQEEKSHHLQKDWLQIDENWCKPHFYIKLTIKEISKHRWFSGRMLACHAGDPGSIPGRCKTFIFYDLNSNATIKETVVDYLLHCVLKRSVLEGFRTVWGVSKQNKLVFLTTEKTNFLTLYQVYFQMKSKLISDKLSKEVNNINLLLLTLFWQKI